MSEHLVRYVADHLEPVDGGWPGRLVLAADFGHGEEPEMPDKSTIDQLLDAAQAQLGHEPDGLRYQRPSEASAKSAWIRWSDEVREAAGIAYEYITQARALVTEGDSGEPGAEPEPEPAPEPFPPPREDGFTAQRHHDGDPRMIDWYPISSGSSKGYELILDRDCTVERMSGVTPLMDHYEGMGTTMHVAVVHAEGVAPFMLGHVASGFRSGQRHAGEVVCVCSDSGIEFERLGIDADAAHFHLQTTNGQPALPLLRQLGFEPAIVERIPGPQDYMNRRARSGRFLF